MSAEQMVGSGHSGPEVSLVLVGGRVISLGAEEGENSAVAIQGDRVAAIGDDGEIRSLIGSGTRVVELNGRTVLPGINDAHLHLALFAQSLPPFSVDLATVDSVAALQGLLTARSRELTDGAWLVGSGWREVNFADFRDGVSEPHRSQLDLATGERPAMLHHSSRHAVWANSAALRCAGVTRTSPDPPGGRIVRDSDGEPTGVLLEAASKLVEDAVPSLSQDQRLDAIASAMQTLNALGITSVTDPVVWPELLRDYIELHRQGRMTVRVNALLHWGWPSPSGSVAGLRDALSYSGAVSGLGDDWLRVGGYKIFADGAPTHRTAWLNEPYLDGTNGSLVTVGADENARYVELLDMVELAHRHRLNVQIHVTGDRAADAAIDALVRANERDPWPEARHALIHGTLLSDAAIERLGQHDIGVVASSLLKADVGPSMKPILGPGRWERTFPVGSLLRAGALVADSSDAPCTFPDWRRGLATFIGAAPHPGAEVAESERVNRAEALRMWTLAGAYLESAEHHKGTLDAGSLADLLVLDEDILSIPNRSVQDVTPVFTVVGGDVVFDLLDAATGTSVGTVRSS